MRQFIHWLTAVLAVMCAGVFGAVGYYQRVLPDAYTVTPGRTLFITENIEAASADPVAVAAAVTGEQYRVELKLFHTVAVKSATVSVVERPTVTVCGTPFGIKLYTAGVLVVGLGDVTTAAGDYGPAAAAGIRVGDTVLSVDGTAVSTNKELARAIHAAGGRAVKLRVCRDGITFDAMLTPVLAVNGEGYQAGMWVRDSTAGVGMLTFYGDDGAFAGLGHAISDADTGRIMPVSGGEIVPARIFSVNKSVAGTPGELCGGFLSGRWGDITVNADNGVYGSLVTRPAGVRYPLALRSEVHTGEATILTTVDGTAAKEYTVRIEKIALGAGQGTKNMVIRVTDEELLQKTGGIVQGMSGSPLLQNGKLVGAVTHVLVDDPARGYAVFAENMLETAQVVTSENKLKDAS